APLLEPGRHAQVSQGVLAEVVVQSRLPRGSAPGALAAEIEKRAARGRIVCANTNSLRRREITQHGLRSACPTKDDQIVSIVFLVMAVAHACFDSQGTGDVVGGLVEYPIGSLGELVAETSANQRGYGQQVIGGIVVGALVIIGDSGDVIQPSPVIVEVHLVHIIAVRKITEERVDELRSAVRARRIRRATDILVAETLVPCYVRKRQTRGDIPVDAGSNGEIADVEARLRERIDRLIVDTHPLRRPSIRTQLDPGAEGTPILEVLGGEPPRQVIARRPQSGEASAEVVRHAIVTSRAAVRIEVSIVS